MQTMMRFQLPKTISKLMAAESRFACWFGSFGQARPVIKERQRRSVLCDVGWTSSLDPPPSSSMWISAAEGYTRLLDDLQSIQFSQPIERSASWMALAYASTFAAFSCRIYKSSSVPARLPQMILLVAVADIIHFYTVYTILYTRYVIYIYFNLNMVWSLGMCFHVLRPWTAQLQASWVASERIR